MEKSYTLAGIGTVKITRSARSRGIRLTVRPFEGVQVLVPPGVSFEFAEKFVVSKREWIQQSLQKMKKHEEGLTIFTEDTPFATRYHKLHITPYQGNTIRLHVKAGRIQVGYPLGADVRDKKIQSAIRKAIEEAWRIEARHFLPGRVSQLAQKHGLRCGKLTFRIAKSRWGSCSSVNNISLNVQLMRLPEHLCDYIILHELTHTVHKNHGKGFWKMLDDLTGNAKALDKEMRNYNLAVW